MSRLRHVHIQGHRRLRDVTLEVRPLTVLIGPNGAGKSAFLDVWRLLARGMQRDLVTGVGNAGGLELMLTRGRARMWRVDIELELELLQNLPQLLSGTANYSLQLQPLQNYSYRIKHESLELTTPDANQLTLIDVNEHGVFFRSESGIALLPNPTHNFAECAIAQAPLVPAVERVRQFLARVEYYGVIDVSANTPIRYAQQIRDSQFPGSNGDQLIPCLHNLREKTPDRYELLEDMLHAAFPDFDRLSFPASGAGTLGLAWHDRKYSLPFFAPELSDGTLRFLWLATLLTTAPRDSITLIDEPEVGLHPEMLTLLSDLLREASQRTNLIIATHSDRLVRSLQPSEVLISDVEDGEVSFRWGDTFDLTQWLTDYSLDELWQMGVIGGRS